MCEDLTFTHQDSSVLRIVSYPSHTWTAIGFLEDTTIHASRGCGHVVTIFRTAGRKRTSKTNVTSNPISSAASTWIPQQRLLLIILLQPSPLLIASVGSRNALVGDIESGSGFGSVCRGKTLSLSACCSCCRDKSRDSLSFHAICISVNLSQRAIVDSGRESQAISYRTSEVHGKSFQP